MWTLRGVVTLALSASLVAALPAQDYAFKVKETVTSPRNWVKHSVPPPDHNIVLRIGLPQSQFNILEEHLYEISDPDHARYGQHLTKEQVEELVAPHPESVEAVNKWLFSHGITEADLSRSPAQDWVTLRIPVSLAEKMLDTSYHVWQHTKDGDYLVRTTSYSLPEELLPHVDVIQPTTLFGRFKGARSTIVWDEDTDLRAASVSDQGLEPIIDAISGVTIDPSCNVTITVSCLKQLYNAVGYVPSANDNSIGLTGYLEQFANFEDLQSFFKDQVPEAVGSSFKFISVKGGLNNQTLSEAGAEANLDVQFALGISHPVPGTFYSTAGRPPFNPDIRTPTDTNEPYTDWLDFVLSHPNPPLTISTSYGDDEQTVPEDFARRACAQFAQLGARGVSVIFSSGDFGVGDGNPDPATQECSTNDGLNATRFIPAFPASCPFVTSVGGTQNINPEVAVSRFFSGGGFSNYFSRPKYQDEQVGKFLDGLPKGLYKDLFNPAGRGIPDVAAQGDRFRIFLSGAPRSIGGTSASSPTFAGIVALLNDARLKAQKSPLGFLNPLLYSKGVDSFNDILSGKNPGCGTEGFNATKGWDPVTGLGTPNFGKLKEIVVKS
ncbi:tripeptidyl peptidase A [Cyathus striatus]|nr:tripeptidyl peptidase A [Cyathus striatus]